MSRTPGAHRLATTLAVLTGTAAVVLGAGAAIRWAVGARGGTGVPSGVGTPPPEAALCLVLAGLGVLLAIGHPSRPRQIAVWGLGGTVALTGLLGLFDHTGLVSPSPISLRARDVLDSETIPSMSPATAVALLLIGLALLTLDARPTRHVTWPQVFAPAAATIGGVTMLAYLFRETSVPAAGALVAMTPLTAFCVAALTVGLIAVRPGEGLLRPLTSLGPGGTLARRVVPILVMLPFGIALLSGVLIQFGAGDPALTVALSTTVFVLVLLVVLGGTAGMIDATDDRQRSLLDALAAERDFTRTLLSSLTEAVLVTDPELRIIDVNPGACTLLDRDRDDLVGRRPPYPWQGEAAGPPRFVERPGGDRVPVLALTAPVLDEHGRPRAFVNTFVDMTEQQQAEARLARHADELAQANTQLELRHKQLTDAAAFKGDLMSIVSHEVSQPLSSVSSLSELLTTEWGDLPDDMRQELAAKIDRNTRRLTGMINDMLLLFRLDAGAVSARRAAVPVAEVIETVCEAQPAGVTRLASLDAQVLALVDRGHLWQVLHNLVDNAVSYGDPPVEITVECQVDGVLIAVRDHGPGIPAEERATLFERVARRSGDKKRVKGTGLGLFIVRHLVELNGGTIWYEAADPRGARLLVRLEPATAQTTPDTLPHEPAQEPAAAPH